MVANTPWDRLHMEYDVFCLHTIWSRAEVAAILGPSATTFTIMRDPVELFESLWSYAGLGSYYNTDLETFALSPKEGLLAQRAFRSVLQHFAEKLFSFYKFPLGVCVWIINWRKVQYKRLRVSSGEKLLMLR